MNTLLDNAVASIQLGVEDFELSKEDPRRVISAIRNLYAGVLLLFKEELARRSPKEHGEPPILLRERLELKFELTSNGLKQKKINKTVDFHGIKQRFKILFYKKNRVRKNFEWLVRKNYLN